MSEVRADTPLPVAARLGLPHKGGGEAAHARVGKRQRVQAKRLRREMTDAERKLWHSLKAHRFQSLHIRRQVPMGRYIADFVCHATKLVIEIDGAQHGFGRNLQADAERDAWFASQGYRVLRFWNRNVVQEHESVLETIFAALQDRLSPTPLRKGEGR